MGCVGNACLDSGLVNGRVILYHPVTGDTPQPYVIYQREPMPHCSNGFEALILCYTAV